LPRNIDAGAAFGIAPGTRPVTQDEVAVGAELALAGALRATLWGQGRTLRHGLETVAGEFGNPGAGGTATATRETELIGFQLELRRRDATAIRTGVTWARTVGTWAGPFDPRSGANQLQSPDWDVDPSNLYGPLPTDAGARLFVEAEHRAAIDAVGLAIAARLTAASGRPRSVLADDGQGGITELVPRGSAGDNPVVAQANVRLAARWRGVDVRLDIVNLFDRRDVTNLDELYTSSAVRPVEGGGASDLVFLKDDAGAPARRRTAFRLPTAYQPPLSVTLGVHKEF
ncbi:MAG TPA: hypothetical protein VK607_23785, partial [Kofleriaceae bacterium]|nr:hypothetical protein [Kofleriaceae bacterium]